MIRIIPPAPHNQTLPMSAFEIQPTAPSVVDATEENFESVALEQSHQRAVVIDFWAEWCAPCRQLAPLLEKIVGESGGELQLVKVNVEEQQRLAGYFQVQSIPAVFILRNGQIADAFNGLLPEAALRERLGKFQATPAQKLAAEAARLESSAPAEAEEKYLAALELAPGEDSFRLSLARFYLQQHRMQDARQQLEHLERRGFLEPEGERIKAELELRSAAAESGELSQLRAQLAANPGQPEVQLSLAEGLAAAHQYEEALELCLQVVQATTGEPRDKARSVMVQMFQVLGPEAELARTFRRRLATLLY
jgi:putative thioredoxin